MIPSPSRPPLAFGHGAVARSGSGGSTKPAPGTDALAWWLETPEDGPGRDRFRAFLDHVPTPMALAVRGGLIVRANPAFCELVGRTEEDLAGTHWTEFTHPDDVPRERALVEQVVGAGGSIIEIEKRYLRPDGTVVPVLLRGTLTRDPDGATSGALIHVADLTRHQTALDRRLHDHHELLRAAFESSTIGMSIMDLEGRFVRVNARMCESLGYTERELLGRSFLEITHPEHVDRDRETNTRLRDGLISHHDTVKRYVRRDGGVLWAAISVSVLRDADGRGEHLFAQWQDVTAGREAEERMQRAYARMRGVAETLPVLVYVLDVVERRLVYINRAIERVGGYTAEEVTSLRGDAFLTTLFHPEDIPLILSEWARLELMPPGGFIETDFRARHRDGTWRLLHSQQSVLERDPDGRPRSHVGVLEDVTERRGIEERLRQSRKMEAVGRLAAGVAHDFNNLLTVILGHADMALHEVPPGSPASADIESVLSAGQRAAAVTRQLLAFARPQAIELRVVDLDAVVRDSLGLVSRIVGEGVRVVTELGGGLGPVRTDPAQVTQALLNMAANSREATRGDGTFTIATADVPAAGADRAHSVRLTVSDDGAGMDAETLSHVFEPFFTTKEVGKGSGLGLSMVYGYVEGMHGSITVQSAPGAGTRFEILLPCVTDPVDAAAEPESRDPVAPGPARHTLLVVEDDPAVRALMRAVLERAGYRVLEAPDGITALARLDDPTEAVELVVTDIVMPGLGGPAMIERARRRMPALRALFVTGYADKPVASGPFAGTHCLRKPFSPEALVRRVRELLGTPLDDST